MNSAQVISRPGATVAARRPEVAFVVSLAGIAVTGYDTIVRQVELILLAAGRSADEAAAAAAQQSAILDLVLARNWESLEALVVDIKRAQIAALPPEQQQALVQALARAGNRGVTVVVLPEANHLFQRAVTGGPEEYALLGAELVPGLLPRIADWISDRAGSNPR